MNDTKDFDFTHSQETIDELSNGKGEDDEFHE